LGCGFCGGRGAVGMWGAGSTGPAWGASGRAGGGARDLVAWCGMALFLLFDGGWWAGVWGCCWCVGGLGVGAVEVCGDRLGERRDGICLGWGVRLVERVGVGCGGRLPSPSGEGKVWLVGREACSDWRWGRRVTLGRGWSLVWSGPVGVWGCAGVSGSACAADSFVGVCAWRAVVGGGGLLCFAFVGGGWWCRITQGTSAGPRHVGGH